MLINVLAATPSITWAKPADINYGTALGGTQLDATANVDGTFTYSPVSGTVLGAGNDQTLSVSFVPNDSTDYSSASASVVINVLRATPTIDWANPADIVFGTALSGSQLDATANVQGTFTYSPVSGTVLGAGNDQTLSVSFVPNDATDYSSASASVVINVLRATPTINWANPADIVFGTALSGSQLDATANVQGTFTYSPVSGTVLGAGNDQTLSVSFVPNDATDYSSASASVVINVLRATPTINWANPADIVFGTALSGSQLDATANVQGTFTYSPVSGTVLGAGNDQTLSVSFVPNDTTDYSSASTSVVINVLRATPTIDWANPADIVFGTALSGSQLDATANVQGTFTYSPVSGTVLGAGNDQTLSVSFVPNDATDYSSASASVVINVLRATPTINWANPADIVFGTALSGSQLDATANVQGTFTYSPVSGTVLGAGNDQTLSVSFVPNDTTNYTSASAAVMINVVQGQAMPTISWAKPADIVYGTALSGTQLDAAANVAGKFEYTPAAGTVLDAGLDQTLSATFTPSDTTDYTTVTATVTINVLHATPTISWANPADIVYGTALSGTQLDATVNVQGTFTYSPVVGTVLGAGNVQTLSVSFAPNDGTDYTTVSATVMINVLRATPSISWANPADIVYGTALSGTQLDASANVQGTFIYTPIAGTVLGAGLGQTLSVSFAPNDATDYTNASASVMINVSRATPSISWANPADIVYGTALSGTQLDASANVEGTFIYTPIAGTVLGAGLGQTLSVSFAPNETTDYTSASAAVMINVSRATPSISWANPAGILFGTALSGTQLDATANVQGTFTYSPVAGTVLGAGSDQMLSVSFAPNDTTDYTSTSATVMINVSRATPTVSWANPADIVYGTALSGTQLDATANVQGTFTYSPVVGTVLGAGNDQTLSVSFAPNDGTDYTTVSAKVMINVLRATPTINWANPAAIAYGTPLGNTELDATAAWTVGGSVGSVDGTYAYTPPSGTVLDPSNSQALSVVFTPADSTDYTTAAGSATIRVYNGLSISSFATIAPNPRNIAVSTIDVTFSEPVKLSTFNALALWRHRQQGPEPDHERRHDQLGLRVDLSDQRPRRADREEWKLLVDCQRRSHPGSERQPWLGNCVDFMVDGHDASHKHGQSACAARDEPYVCGLCQWLGRRLTTLGPGVIRYLFEY